MKFDKNISLLQNSTSGELGVFAGRCLGDLASAMKNADDTAFYLGSRIGTLSIVVTGNYRLTFTIKDEQIHNLNLEDYH